MITPEGFSMRSDPRATTVASKSLLRTLAGLPDAALAEATPLTKGPIPSAQAGIAVVTRRLAAKAGFSKLRIRSLSWKSKCQLSRFAAGQKIPRARPPEDSVLQRIDGSRSRTD